MTRCIVIGCGPLRFYTQGAQDITKTCSLGHTDPGTLVRNLKKKKKLVQTGSDEWNQDKRAAGELEHEEQWLNQLWIAWNS